MFLKAVYNTNEVLGSFWRPHDYMAHVPTPKVIGADTLSLNNDAVNVSLSEAGLSMASKMTTATQPATIDISADNDELKKNKRYVYNGIEGTVSLVDMAM